MSPPVLLCLSRVVMCASGSGDCHPSYFSNCLPEPQREGTTSQNLLHLFPLQLISKQIFICSRHWAWHGLHWESHLLPLRPQDGNRYLVDWNCCSVQWESNVQPSGEGSAWFLFLSYVTACTNDINSWSELKVWCHKFWFAILYL